MGLIDKLWLQPFAYDESIGRFMIAGRECEFENFDDAIKEAAANNAVGKSLFDTAPLAYWLHHGPVILPTMSDWLRQCNQLSAAEGASAAMEAAYRQQLPESIMTTGLHMNVVFPPDEHQLPRFETVGSAACLIANTEGILGEKVWVDKVASYTTINVDTPAQRASVLAGIGHLAFKVSRQT